GRNACSSSWTRKRSGPFGSWRTSWRTHRRRKQPRNASPFAPAILNFALRREATTIPIAAWDTIPIVSLAFDTIGIVSYDHKSGTESMTSPLASAAAAKSDRPRLPERPKLALRSDVIPEPSHEANRIALWVPGAREGAVQHWQRISNLPHSEITV